MGQPPLFGPSVSRPLLDKSVVLVVHVFGTPYFLEPDKIHISFGSPRPHTVSLTPSYRPYTPFKFYSGTFLNVPGDWVRFPRYVTVDETDTTGGCPVVQPSTVPQ